MNRARAWVPPDAIRIEDEVWQEAFRETSPPRARPRLRSLDGGRTDRPVAARPASRPASPRPANGAERRVVTPGGRAAMPSKRSTAPAPVAVAARTPDAPEPGWAPPEPGTRRTVTITGRGAERNLPWPTESSRRRETRRLHERAGFRPDKFAMWALFLGLVLVLVAATSAHA